MKPKSLSKKEEFTPHIIFFYCHNCTISAENAFESMREQGYLTFRTVKLPCSGKIEILYLLRAFEEGADGVVVIGCPEGECHYLEGNVRTSRRVHFTRKMLNEIGLGENRLHMVYCHPSQPSQFLALTKDMVDKICTLKPSPLKRFSSQTNLQERNTNSPNA